VHPETMARLNTKVCVWAVRSICIDSRLKGESDALDSINHDEFSLVAGHNAIFAYCSASSARHRPSCVNAMVIRSVSGDTRLVGRIFFDRRLLLSAVPNSVH